MLLSIILAITFAASDSLAQENTFTNPLLPNGPDGTEDWNLYHAREARQGTTPRNPRAQKVEWTEDDFPILGIPASTDSSLVKPSGIK